MTASRTSHRILCIEDELLLLNDLQEELTASGYQVRGASSVAHALEVLVDFSPDLILCDIMLGSDDQPDGYNFHEHIRNNRPDLAATPFILLTALGQRDDLLLAKRQGIDDYLVKPVDYDLLLATINARLASVLRVKDTQHHQHETLLSRMRELFAQLPGAILLCDGHGALLYANYQAQILMQNHALWRVSKLSQLQWPQAIPSSLQLLHRSMLEMNLAPVGERRVQCLEMTLASDNVLLSLLKLDGEPHSPADKQLFAWFICSAQSRPLPEANTLRLLFGFTPSEAKVARLLAQGLRPESIAIELNVSTATINFHLRNLFQKTEVTRQTELVAQVLAVGWTLPDIPGNIQCKHGKAG